MSNIGIIGGGASGLMAAIFAAQKGHAVTILERLDRVGKKILATGNGRCNITNTDISLLHYHGAYVEDMFSAFSYFSPQDTISFFESIGVDMIAEENGKMYPRSLQAGSVLDNLRYECARLGVSEQCGFEVKSIRTQKDGFLLTSYQGESRHFDKIILSTGGKAASKLGSNGTGYDLAKSLGHHVSNTFAALCKIQVTENFLKGISGVKFNGTICVNSGQKSKIDEILFTDNGLSGPAVFSVSREISALIEQKKPVRVTLDLCPDLDTNMLFRLLMDRFDTMPYKTASESLIGFVNKKLIFSLLHTAGIDKKTLSSSISKAQINALCGAFKSWEFHIEKVAPFADAQVCCGGVDTSEICKETMESKKCPGVFLTGELLDIDGDCGGFNLQWAWTSGAIAGQNI